MSSGNRALQIPRHGQERRPNQPHEDRRPERGVDQDQAGHCVPEVQPEKDVEDLLQWEQVFGEGFKAVLAFMYWIEAPLTPGEGMFEHKGRWYLLLAVDLSEYRNHMRRRSAKWETVALPAAEFRSLARPLQSWL